MSAEFKGAPLTEVHQYSFYAPQGTVLSTTMTADSSLTPELKVFTKFDAAVNLGATQTGGTIKNFTFTTTGEYYFQVRSTAGTGAYKLSSKVKFPKSIAGATTTGTFPFDALGGTVMGAQVKATKGSTAIPKITALTYLGGTVDLGAAVGSTKLSKINLPMDNTFTLVIDPTTAGQSVDVKITLTAPKTGRLWSFGYVEATKGLATENRAKWLGSGHADHTAMAFNDWNDANPPVVPTTCARCHSTSGYRDFLGVDGTAVGVVNNAVPVGEVVNCDACHNDATAALTSVTFPSGLSVSGLGNEARCMVCHQGRESAVSVETAMVAATRKVFITNNEAAGTGIVGTAAAIPPGTTFTDTGANFTAAVSGSVLGDGSYYLEFVTATANLNGTAGVVATKNGRYKIVGGTADTLSLDPATPMNTETAAAGKSYQYKLVQIMSDDVPNGAAFAAISFRNVHYFAAGATLYGREAAGMYQYADPANGFVNVGAGNSVPVVGNDPILTTMTKRNGYDRKFTHVAAYDTCVDCHDVHTLKVKVTECGKCHVAADGNAVATTEPADDAAYETAITRLHDVRMAATYEDYNGNGNTTEGVYYEYKGMQDKLLAAIQAYANTAIGTGATAKPALPIEYDAANYPYFFIGGSDHTNRANGYNKFTARLLRAAYNYQFAEKDPGAFAHNAKYVLECMYDSIADLNAAVAVPNFSKLARNDPGHFDSDDEPYRDWESSGAISASCSRCHSVEGLQFVVKYGFDITVTTPVISGMSCESCHTAGTNFGTVAINPNTDKKPDRLYVKSAFFPYPNPGATSAQVTAVTITNGAVGTTADDESFLCMTCHRGRESTLTLDAGDVGGLVTTFTLSAKNPHYFPAGAVQYGTKAAVGYQYTGKTYVQRWDHDLGYSNAYPLGTAAKAKCEYCHMGSGGGISPSAGTHNFKYMDKDGAGALADVCVGCHSTSTTVKGLVVPASTPVVDYDSNPATKSKAEVDVFATRLADTILAYSKTKTTAAVSGADWIVYYDASNPGSTASKGFYKDLDHNGSLSLTELAAGSAKLDSKLYRACFNYRIYGNDPGAWAHNPKYMRQILFDSIVDLGGDTTGLTRP